MRLVGFQVEWYKSIRDSGWVNVTPLTVVVGKNESGKTSLLKALHKFNPYTPAPYDRRTEWPRGNREKASDNQIVCTAEFELDENEFGALTALTDVKVTERRVRIAKDYAGRFYAQLSEKSFPPRPHLSEIEAVLHAIPDVPEEVPSKFKKEASGALKELTRHVHEGRFAELEALVQSHTARLTAARSEDQDAPQYTKESQFIDAYSASASQVLQKLRQMPTILKKATDYIISKIPTFVYMDEYRIFRGTAVLNQVKERKDQNRLQEDDETFLTILNLAGLDLEQEHRKASEGNREERQYDFSDAAATLTRRMASHWGALAYEIDFRGDGYHFFTFVRDSKDDALIKLEERSRGFQWFFSFDAMFMRQTQGTFKGCVLLLDEPGLHLHPSAQRDLLERLDDYSNGNTVIYTTHLPFMIDLQEPDRIRVLSETPEGTVVTEDLTKTQPEAKLTLQAALGISGRTSYMVADQNLVVEGVHDYWYVTAFSGLLARTGGTPVLGDVMITAAGGASEVTYIATFMIGQELEVVALYDSDGEGLTAKEKLIHNWLARYKDRRASALCVGEAMGSKAKEAAIEDLFTDDFYVKYVLQTYQKELTMAGAEKVELPEGGQLCKRVESYFSEHGLKFNKGSVAKRICAEIRATPDGKAIPKATLERAQKLILAINAGFGAAVKG